MSRAWWSDYILNVRYTNGGRTFPEVDCYGLDCAVFKRELDIELESWEELVLTDLFSGSRSLLEGAFTTDFSTVEMGLEQAFDIAVIRRPITIEGKTRLGWWHTGVVSRPGHVLHCDEAHDAVEQPFRDTTLSRAFVTFREKDVRLFRHKSLGDGAVALRACA